jgi:hypothetical protein
MRISSPSAKSFIAVFIILAGLSGLPGCDSATSAPKDAAADPAAVAPGKATTDAATQKAGKKVPKSIKDLGK